MAWPPVVHQDVQDAVTALLAAVPAPLTGAVAATRFAGGTASGAPTTGTFAVGDFVADQSGTFWICTVAGTPGTWVQSGSAAYAPIGAASTVSGQTARVETDETTTSVTYADLATVGPSVTITPGPSGKALVTVSASLYGGSLLYQRMSFVVSGGNTVAATDNKALAFTPPGASLEGSGSMALMLTGLAAVSSTFKAQYKVQSTNTAHFRWREISVVTW